MNFSASGMYGQLGGGIATHHDATFLGMMDDVVIYNEVLGEAQIQALMIPEPATLVLLSVGGLMSLRKRE